MPAPTYNIGIMDDGLQKVYAALATDANRIEYVGKAHPGTATNSTLWQIQKWTWDANGFLTNIKFAEGNADFKFDWTARAGYAYA